MYNILIKKNGWEKVYSEEWMEEKNGLLHHFHYACISSMALKPAHLHPLDFHHLPSVHAFFIIVFVAAVTGSCSSSRYYCRRYRLRRHYHHRLSTFSLVKYLMHKKWIVELLMQLRAIAITLCILMRKKLRTPLICLLSPSSSCHAIFFIYGTFFHLRWYDFT